MTTPTPADRNWFQRILDRFTGNDKPSESTFRYNLGSTIKSPAEQATARAEARASMEAFREEHVRAQGTTGESPVKEAQA